MTARESLKFLIKWLAMSFQGTDEKTWFLHKGMLNWQNDDKVKLNS